MLSDSHLEARSRALGVLGSVGDGQPEVRQLHRQVVAHQLQRDGIFIEPMMSDRKLKASREGSE